MATFGAWLSTAEGSSRVSEQARYISKLWNSTEGKRPKVHSPASIENYMSTAVEEWRNQPDQHHDAFDAVVREYHALRDGPENVRPAEGMPAGGNAQLDRIESKLDRLISALGLDESGDDGSTTLPDAPSQPGADMIGDVRAAMAWSQPETAGRPAASGWDDIDWLHVWKSADHTEAEGDAA